jgi:hypothetical protein
MTVGYYVVSLRGRELKEGSIEAAVLPITQKRENLFTNERIFTEKVWWYDLNVINSYQYMKVSDSETQLVERTCIIGVYRTNTYNMYFRCVYEYAELAVYLKN